MQRSLLSVAFAVLATDGWKAVAADIPKFATGGVAVLLGTKTN